jgi:hypothetical protein
LTRLDETDPPATAQNREANFAWMAQAVLTTRRATKLAETRPFLDFLLIPIALPMCKTTRSKPGSCPAKVQNGLPLAISPIFNNLDTAPGRGIEPQALS